MALNTCLSFDGDCRQALESYARLLDGKVMAMMTFGDMLKELFPSIDTTPASSEVGRVLQLIKASGWSLDK